jgi:hypothetical protein
LVGLGSVCCLVAESILIWSARAAALNSWWWLLVLLCFVAIFFAVTFALALHGDFQEFRNEGGILQSTLSCWTGCGELALSCVIAFAVFVLLGGFY